MNTEIDFYPQRIVCLTEEPTEILYLLGEDKRIVGISGYTVRPSHARKEKPKVSTFIDANIESILSLQPDLVIGFSDIQADIAKMLISKGIAVLINNHRSVDEIFKTIVQIGSLVGKTHEAIILANQYKNNIVTISAFNRAQHLKPKVYFEEWFDPIITGIRWVSELIEMAGGIDVFESHRTASLAKERIVQDHHKVVSLNPDIIIASWCGKKFNKEKLVSRTNWSQINAVKTDFVFEIKSAVILQPGPAAVTDGITQLVEIIKSWHNSQNLNQNLNDKNKG